MKIPWTENVWIVVHNKKLDDHGSRQIIGLPASAVNEYSTRVRRAIIQEQSGTISRDELMKVINPK